LSSDKIFFKVLSFRLNIRPYNKLDKEVIDFRECKDGLATLYNTRYFYLKAKILQEWDEGIYT